MNKLRVYGGSLYKEMMAVYEGREGKALVFQPRLQHWFDVNYQAGSLSEHYEGLYLDEVYKDLGVTPREVWGLRKPGTEHAGYMALKVVEGDDVELWERRTRSYSTDSVDQIITEYRTPKGTIRQIQRLTEKGTSLMNVEYFLKDLNDLKVFEYILQERNYDWDNNRFKWGEKRFGDLIPLRANLERIPLMWLIVGIMGFHKTVTMLWRHPKEMEEFMGILEEEHLKQIEAYKGKPIVELNFGDNMHQDLCPPHYFRDYVIPFFQRVIPKIHGQNMYATSHWDGFLKQLMPLVGETGLDGLECVTPLPQGDVSLEEIKEGMGDMFLRDGIPAIMFCSWTDVKILEVHVRKLMDMFYPRLILGISDLLPANGEIERVELVKELVKKFNLRL